MINRVILTGRLTNNVELRKTNDGTPYTFFTLAVARNGRTDQTDFINCTAWRGTAELMAKFLNKGALIGAEGRIEVFTQQRDGNYDTRVNVNVSQITFLESKNQAQERNGSSDQLSFDKEVSVNQTTMQTSPAKTNNAFAQKEVKEDKNEKEEEIDWNSIEF